MRLWEQTSVSARLGYGPPDARMVNLICKDFLRRRRLDFYLGYSARVTLRPSSLIKSPIIFHWHIICGRVHIPFHYSPGRWKIWVLRLLPVDLHSRWQDRSVWRRHVCVKTSHCCCIRMISVQGSLNMDLASFLWHHMSIRRTMALRCSGSLSGLSRNTRCDSRIGNTRCRRRCRYIGYVLLNRQHRKWVKYAVECCRRYDRSIDTLVRYLHQWRDGLTSMLRWSPHHDKVLGSHTCKDLLSDQICLQRLLARQSNSLCCGWVGVPIGGCLYCRQGSIRWLLWNVLRHLDPTTCLGQHRVLMRTSIGIRGHTPVVLRLVVTLIVLCLHVGVRWLPWACCALSIPPGEED